MSVAGRATRDRSCPGERLALERRTRRLAWGGNAWHLIEFAIALGGGIAAGSVALIGFRADSLIEVFSGLVIAWLFTAARGASEDAERLARRLIAISYFVLTAYMFVESLRDIIGGHHPQTSWVGIALAAVTAVTMPILARAKRGVGAKLGSAATTAEAEQNQICAYLPIVVHRTKRPTTAKTTFSGFSMKSLPSSPPPLRGTEGDLSEWLIGPTGNPARAARPAVEASAYRAVHGPGSAVRQTGPGGRRSLVPFLAQLKKVGFQLGRGGYEMEPAGGDTSGRLVGRLDLDEIGGRLVAGVSDEARRDRVFGKFLAGRGRASA